ncbi:glutamyl-tRNA reductase-binding protein, chloroplastic-like [Chenopodium quinoa]|uniref:glutamyl-tRNA reductase-binding protein, chloroplastic-like n=1 Tax=Chenopodium quinoa TaxID=63459 RepID=UPI000B78961C|nr:glutamyl-tRNA reductase-binding protein, chloroplastic-like [Chenopodium quinoa]
MILQTQSLSSHIIPSNYLPTQKLKSSSKPLNFFSPKSRKSPLKCSSISVASDPSSSTTTTTTQIKPYPAEVSRTIMELSSSGTLSTLTHDGWPLGIGVRFTVDSDGTPILCTNLSNRHFSIDKRSTLHVQLPQCGLRTPQCTIQGSLDKPDDKTAVKKLHSAWKKRFGEEINEDLLYVVSVDRILQLEDFQEDGVWVTSSDYKNAYPDPLRDIAEKVVTEINANNMEDVLRFCSIYADLQFQVSEAKMVWVDRLGFDMRLYSPPSGMYEIRIPFPREVTDEKGVKSTFNGMSQIAWEVEKNYYPLDFKRVKQVKNIVVAGS